MSSIENKCGVPMLPLPLTLPACNFNLFQTFPEKGQCRTKDHSKAHRQLSFQKVRNYLMSQSQINVLHFCMLLRDYLPVRKRKNFPLFARHNKISSHLYRNRVSSYLSQCMWLRYIKSQNWGLSTKAPLAPLGTSKRYDGAPHSREMT